MPPKKTSQRIHLVVDQVTSTDSVRVVEAYTTEEAAEQAIETLTNDPDGGDYGNLGVVTVELKTAAAPKKSTKATETKVASRGKATKKAKAEEDDEDEDDEEQAEANEKKTTLAEKRKQVVEGDADALSGLKLLFTGTFTMDRKTCEATAVKAGASIVSTMKQADIIVLGVKPGPKKVTEIEDNGYKTWDEEEFLGKVKGSEDKAAGPKKKKA